MYRVLLVDDEIKIIQWLEKTIPWEKYGFTVCELCTGSLPAINYIENHEVDLIITDIRMPGLNGLDLIRRLHECKPSVLTIILSGYNQFEYAQQALKYGVKGFLLKPLVPEELEDLLLPVAKELSRRPTEADHAKAHAEPSSASLTDTPMTNSSKLNEVIDYIDKNYNKDLYLKGCADLFGFHPAYLGKIFKDTVGCSFNSYLNRKRIARLKKLLNQSNLPVNQLLESVGYHNYEYFYTVFKKYEGISFSEYRAAMPRQPK